MVHFCIWLDRKLNFKAHIDYVRNKCQKYLNLLKILAHYSWGADRKTLLQLFRSFIRSTLDYGSIVYGAARPSYLKRLGVVQNQALRTEFLNLLDRYPNSYIFYTDGSKSEDAMSVYTAELIAINETLTSIALLPYDEFVICTDFLSSILAISSIDLIHPYVQSILQKCTCLAGRDKRIIFIWCPSHVGIPGNETADTVAKQALGMNILNCHIPHTDFKPITCSFVKTQWQSEWDQETGNKLHDIQPDIGSWPPSKACYRDSAYVPEGAEALKDEERRLKRVRRNERKNEKAARKAERKLEKMARKKELKEKRMDAPPSPSPSDGYTTIIIDDTAVPAILSPIQDPPSPAPSDSEDDEPLTLKRPSLVMPSDSEDDEPVTVLVSPVQDPPSVATCPDPTRYVAYKKMPSPASSDSESKGDGNDEPAPLHLPVPPFLLGSSLGAEVEVGGDDFAEAAGMVDAIGERLADPPTPSAPSNPRKRKSEEEREEGEEGATLIFQ
ncbi:hypothetical protein CAPTEDRAFT_219461 [Capitella teleta]|uniref:RNase H type-1 domain-containing protein n=1 Tax=Capitella teleta TaxID=283909 RepID=X2APL7_CAPTE|nr:hypothetical protein CAPTEDRAFT_219461 [Capitella teleta]|eukprot:ELU10076.1 hypothetical protein CAPTEDRAFT_219461 [Capitella teleta]